MKILIICNSNEIVQLIENDLRKDFEVFSCSYTDENLTSAYQINPDLIVLDLDFPEEGGWKICRNLKLKKETNTIPIILIAEKYVEVEDKVRGLEMADDFLSKPFSPQELLARIKTILRRYQKEPEEVLITSDKGIILNVTIHTVQIEEPGQGYKQIDLAPKEFALLYLLMKKKNRVLSRSFLSEAVWEQEFFDTTHTIEVHINRLRSKLGHQGEKIATIKGYGYKFLDPE